MPSAENFEWPQGNPLFEVQWRTVTESLAGNGIVSNGDFEVTATATDMEISVAAGTAFYIGSNYSLGGAETHVLSDGDANDDRWDTVYFDTSTTSSGVREGTPAANPEPPDVQGSELLLAIVYVPSGATNISDQEILNWRAKFSNEAEEVHYDDTTGTYGVSSVDAALDELQEAAQITQYPLSIATDTEANGYPLQNSDIANSSVDVNAGTGLTTTNATIGLGGSETLSIPEGGVSSTEIADGTIVDGDISSSTTIARGKLDDERATTGPHTSNVATNGEEVLLVDTSGGAVTVTLSTADVSLGNFITVVDVGGAAGTNAITLETESGETIDGSSSKQITSNFSALVVNSDATNWFTAAGSGSGGGVDVEDNGGTVVSGSTSINFATDLGVTDDGDGTVTVDSQAAGITVLQEGTFTHTGGSATTETVTGVTTDQTENLYVEVGVDSDPSFSADYAWDYDEDFQWDDANQQQDVVINAEWVTDPGSGNDVVLDYRIYTLEVSVSKSRIQDLVDSPNGNVPTALLEDTESIEISVPVPDGESLKVYRWGAYKIADGTAPTGLQVQLLDAGDTVQASENTVNSENTSSPVASHGNSSGSLSIFKLRINNNTGTNFGTDGVGGVFAYVVE